jgi:DNA helicase HerA-like ATPase
MKPEQIPFAYTAHGVGIVLTPEDFERHIFIAGKSGTGKSTLLYNLVLAQICAAEGVAVIDPHGDLALDVLDAIPQTRINDVCYLDPTDTERPVGFNPVAQIAPERRALAAAGIVSAFKHLWSDSWGPRLEYFLLHGLIAIVSRPHATLLDLPRLYTDDAFRDHVLRHVSDPETLRFWRREFPSYTKALRSEAVAPILNKVGQFTASPELRLILGQVAPRFDLRMTMDRRKIFIANLAKGSIGEQAANLLGSLIVSHLQLLAMERGSKPRHERTPFFVAVDEFPNLSSHTFATLLSESRKFGLQFALVAQFLDAVPPIVRSAILGNVGTLIVLRVGSHDSQLLAPEFRPMDAGALTDQEPFTAWFRSGLSRERIFLEPKLHEITGVGEAIKAQSRARFGMPRAKIEARWRHRL